MVVDVLRNIKVRWQVDECNVSTGNVQLVKSGGRGYRMRVSCVFSGEVIHVLGALNCKTGRHHDTKKRNGVVRMSA